MIDSNVYNNPPMSIPHLKLSPSFSYLTPAPLLQERGYISDYLFFTPLLLVEKGMGNEVKNQD
jgi:hypothetical protein